VFGLGAIQALAGVEILNQRNARSWSSVVDFYRELVEKHGLPLRPMLELVEKISKSAYAVGLLPDTSVHTLYVAQSESGLSEFPRLRVECGADCERLRFTYEDGFNGKKWWHREVEADQGFATLERFLMKRARWFKSAGDTPA
jgi:hypothetical protein